MENAIFIFISFGSFFFWLSLFRLAYHLMTSYFQTRKWEISHHHTMNMCEAFVSAVQALISSVCGITIVFSCYHDVMRAVHPLATWYGWVASTYFVYDTIIMYEVHLASLHEIPPSFSKRLKSYWNRRTLLIVHHVFIAAFLFPVLVYRSGVGDFFVGCFFCVELSGPFTNMRIILSRIGLKNSRWYALNGVLMIISFTVCRILVFPYMYQAYGQQYGLDIVDVIKAIPLHCNCGTVLVFLPQLYWLGLMIQGAVKLSKGKNVSEAEEKID